MTALADLGRERYISITTFKRDGTPVSTPVWVAGDDGRLLVWSADSSWKVKRIRRDGHVRVAPCGPTGKLRGSPLEARATIVSDTTIVARLLARKYGLLYRATRALTALDRRLRRRPDVDSVTIAIVPEPAPDGGAGASR